MGLKLQAPLYVQYTSLLQAQVIIEVLKRQGIRCTAASHDCTGVLSVHIHTTTIGFYIKPEGWKLTEVRAGLSFTQFLTHAAKRGGLFG